MIVKVIPRRCYSSTVLSNLKIKKKKSLNLPSKNNNAHGSILSSIQPDYPARTRFAPSPTGFLHLGSLRTCLYNYLLARATKGKFILRLEDTDQNRLVPNSEQSIYDTLRWLGITYDEGPEIGGEFSPYRQSERKEIYLKYIQQLLLEGKAYRCFCKKERLINLKNSAKMLKPPTTVSYDRHCLHHYTPDESFSKAANGEEFTVRFKSPEKYEPFVDLLHGKINLQPQINVNDVRYDDPILFKSDGLPTYHFANIVDDHLMEITHVIRGEEWMPSTPKHIALYKSFGWTPPHFVHIPLLTSIEGDKKLSKRAGDIDIMSLRKKGYLIEAIINFSVLFGWAPKREEQGKTYKELYKLQELENIFSIDNLTKGNTKVDFKKLDYFNKYYLSNNLENDEFFKEKAIEKISQLFDNDKTIDKNYILEILTKIGSSLTTLNELASFKYHYLFSKPNLDNEIAVKFLKEHDSKIVIKIMDSFLEKLENYDIKQYTIEDIINSIYEELNLQNKKIIFETLRFGLCGSISGIKLPVLISLLGIDEVKERILLSKEKL
ncbi:hypothetical protein PACTADRAFT_38055 [Pachysolen tannophilus NRRL Y-2460]|uniref:Glutamate--tRNA ligase, mitochondrial n=1 Tax=Pachysolen tannophilus NRRL Y-2460 TaxID=669874 RepID=A0A1E4U2X1_PACTA|nr:hypothetical protein PACTADRAFT_38055 [Pachysolen tannophilus NRRL Y-2460]